MFLRISLFSLLYLSVAARFDDISFLEEFFIKKEGDIREFTAYILRINQFFPVSYNVTKIPGMRSTALRDDDAKWENGEVPVYFSLSFSNLEYDSSLY